MRRYDECFTLGLEIGRRCDFIDYSTAACSNFNQLVFCQQFAHHVSTSKAFNGSHWVAPSRQNPACNIEKPQLCTSLVNKLLTHLNAH